MTPIAFPAMAQYFAGLFAIRLPIVLASLLLLWLLLQATLLYLLALDRFGVGYDTPSVILDSLPRVEGLPERLPPLGESLSQAVAQAAPSIPRAEVLAFLQAKPAEALLLLLIGTELGWAVLLLASALVPPHLQPSLLSATLALGETRLRRMAAKAKAREAAAFLAHDLGPALLQRIRAQPTGPLALGVAPETALSIALKVLLGAVLGFGATAFLSSLLLLDATSPAGWRQWLGSAFLLLFLPASCLVCAHLILTRAFPWAERTVQQRWDEAARDLAAARLAEAAAKPARFTDEARFEALLHEDAAQRARLAAGLDTAAAYRRYRRAGLPLARLEAELAEAG